MDERIGAFISAGDKMMKNLVATSVYLKSIGFSEGKYPIVQISGSLCASVEMWNDAKSNFSETEPTKAVRNILKAGDEMASAASSFLDYMTRPDGSIDLVKWRDELIERWIYDWDLAVININIKELRRE